MRATSRRHLHSACNHVEKIIIIIIMLRYHYGNPWPSLAIPPYRSSLPAGLQGYTPYLHRAAVCRFELVALPLFDHVKKSTGVHHLWARPYFSSSVLRVWFINFEKKKIVGKIISLFFTYIIHISMKLKQCLSIIDRYT